MVAENNTRVIITIPKELKEQLLQIADKEGRSLSNLFIWIAKKYINNENVSK